MRCLCHVFSWLTQCNQAFSWQTVQKKIQFHTARATETTVSRTARRTVRATEATQTLSAVSNSHENVPPDVVKPAGVVMKTARHLHRHNNRGET